MLNVFAPHMGEELYEKLSGETGISYSDWPEFDPSKLVLDNVQIVVQINGKLRAKFEAKRDLSDEDVLKLVKVRAEAMDVTIVTPADGPSFGIAPSGT